MRDFLARHFKFSEEEYLLFLGQAKLKTYQKGETLLAADMPVEKIYFVKDGLLRGYRILDGLDVTHHFFVADWFATDYQSFLTGKQGELFIESLSATSVYEFSKKNLFSFYRDYPKFEKIRALLAENAYLQMVERLKDFQTKDLKERYLHLIGKSPELFQLVSQKHIASYLGVAPQSLSRIKEIIRKA